MSGSKEQKPPAASTNLTMWLQDSSIWQRRSEERWDMWCATENVYHFWSLSFKRNTLSGTHPNHRIKAGEISPFIHNKHIQKLILRHREFDQNHRSTFRGSSSSKCWWCEFNCCLTSWHLTYHTLNTLTNFPIRNIAQQTIQGKHSRSVIILQW